jgi:hypothetical protein
MSYSIPVMMREAREHGMIIKHCNEYHVQICRPDGAVLVNVWPTKSKFLHADASPRQPAKVGALDEVIELAVKVAARLPTKQAAPLTAEATNFDRDHVPPDDTRQKSRTGNLLPAGTKIELEGKLSSAEDSHPKRLRDHAAVLSEAAHRAQRHAKCEVRANYTHSLTLRADFANEEEANAAFARVRVALNSVDVAGGQLLVIKPHPFPNKEELKLRHDFGPTAATGESSVEYWTGKPAGGPNAPADAPAADDSFFVDPAQGGQRPDAPKGDIGQGHQRCDHTPPPLPIPPSPKSSAAAGSDVGVKVSPLLALIAERLEATGDALNRSLAAELIGRIRPVVQGGQ